MEQFNWTAIILGFAVGWIITKLVQGYLEAKNLMLEADIADLKERIKDNFIHVDIEKHGQVFYLFEKETNRFIAQGTNFEEIATHCKERFKNKSVVATEEQMEQFGLK